MVKYSCERCGKEFSQKSHYDSHNRRKTPCENNADKIKALVDKAVEEKLKELNNKLDTSTNIRISDELIDEDVEDDDTEPESLQGSLIIEKKETDLSTEDLIDSQVEPVTAQSEANIEESA